MTLSRTLPAAIRETEKHWHRVVARTVTVEEAGMVYRHTCACGAVKIDTREFDREQTTGWRTA